MEFYHSRRNRKAPGASTIFSPLSRQEHGEAALLLPGQLSSIFSSRFLCNWQESASTWCLITQGPALLAVQTQGSEALVQANGYLTQEPLPATGLCKVRLLAHWEIRV